MRSPFSWAKDKQRQRKIRRYERTASKTVRSVPKHTPKPMPLATRAPAARYGSTKPLKSQQKKKRRAANKRARI